jgi:hypothetical protein
VSFETLRLGSHLTVPELDVAHRVSTDDRPVGKHSNSPDYRLLALELIDGHAVD